MDTHIDDILQKLLHGEITLEECSHSLHALGMSYIDAEGMAKLDLDRRKRTGIPEAIFCPGKSVDQVVTIAKIFIQHGFTNIIGSRATKEIAEQVRRHLPDTTYYQLSTTLLFHPSAQTPSIGNVGIVTAGTSDMAIAEEVEIVCRVLGSKTTTITDVGVASIQRVLTHLDELRSMNVIVVVAGMEGALPSVIAGLVNIPIIALPTSIGYGVNAGGFNALLSNLGSCVPGVMTVNIDNGFGAACAAHKINNAIALKSADRSG